MYKRNEVRQMTSRYCPKLDDNVVVMTSSDENGFEKRTCLSSHLCHSDDSTTCSHNSGRADGAEGSQQLPM